MKGRKVWFSVVATMVLLTAGGLVLSQALRQDSISFVVSAVRENCSFSGVEVDLHGYCDNCEQGVDYEWVWDFGDGIVSDPIVFSGGDDPAVTTQYTYAMTGNLTIQATVNRSGGGESWSISEDEAIRIYPQIIAAPSQGRKPLKPTFREQLGDPDDPCHDFLELFVQRRCLKFEDPVSECIELPLDEEYNEYIFEENGAKPVWEILTLIQPYTSSDYY